MRNRMHALRDAATRRSTRARSWLLFAMLGGLGLAGALVGRYFLYRGADLSHLDTSPLPRQKRDAPFITTPQAVVDKMIEMAELGPDDLVYDLGCGDGRIVLTAAAKHGCHGVGIDKDPQRVAEARAARRPRDSKNS